MTKSQNMDLVKADLLKKKIAKGMFIYRDITFVKEKCDKTGCSPFRFSAESKTFLRLGKEI